KARFAGICFLYSAQYANQQNGLDPSVRVNLAAKILPGEKVPDRVIDLVLSDPKGAPRVPQNVIRDKVGTGSGVAEITGQESFVYKSFYEDDHDKGLEWSDILRERLESIRPHPEGSDEGVVPWSEITRLLPKALERPGGADTDHAPSRIEDEGGFGLDGRDVADQDEPLRGAAKAAHASAVEQAMAVARSSALGGQ
ncbi:MAG: cell division protein FtsK, partial [Bifidobacteriales bacterium]|nr:cell division protein FtsK [Bifidobacteriales bacterium]